MCELFSFSISKDGNILAVLGDERKEAIRKSENPDSHSYIAETFKVSEDECWKYEMKAVSPLPSSIDEVMEKLEYDGGLPEEEIPLSYVQKLKKWWEENQGKIEQAIQYTLYPTKMPRLYTVLDDIVNGNSEGNIFLPLEKDSTTTTIWEELKGWGERYSRVKDITVKINEEKHNITIIINPKILIYYRPNGVEEATALLVVGYKRPFIESGNIAYQKRIAIYPFATEQG